MTNSFSDIDPQVSVTLVASGSKCLSVCSVC